MTKILTLPLEMYFLQNKTPEAGNLFPQTPSTHLQSRRNK